MIVDDLALRVGSSNLNSRSMRLDTECDVLIATTLAANGSCSETIRAFRDGLLSEHLGLDAQTVSAKIDECGSLVAAIEALRGRAKSLRPYETPDLSAVEAWLADHDVLAPADDEDPFEPLAKRRILARPRLALRRLHAAKPL
jgi:phosphatidylserine/phosphatidylglycerophosphate/cardiolipin synthase-like enzyme